MKPRQIGNCENCIFWDNQTPSVSKPLKQGYGECHVYPPTTDPIGGKPAVYPVTRSDWWCNEYQNRRRNILQWLTLLKQKLWLMAHVT